jgi:hypothetical protein
MNNIFLPTEPICKCTVRVKNKPEVLVLIFDCVYIVYSRV